MKSRKQTDTGYPITATLKSGAPAVAFDLTGSTVTVSLRNKQTGFIKVNEASCTITSAAAGQVSYQPSSGDVDTAGVYDLEFKVVRPNASILHFPSSGYEPLTIEPNLG